jgi:hypothetical protein
MNGAWLDPSATDSDYGIYTGMTHGGRYIHGYSCQSWTKGAMYSGTYVMPSGTMDNGGDCAASRPLACCNTPSKVRFAGFTTATTPGSLGGRAKAHALCAAEFAGSHLCHAAEFIRTNSATTIPTGGAWLDPSASGRDYGTYTGLPAAGRYIHGYACQSWTKGAMYSGTYVMPSGIMDNGGDCATSRPLACCQ